MTIVIPSTLEDRLKQIAAEEGRDVQSLLADPRFGAALQEALRQTLGVNGSSLVAKGATNGSANGTSNHAQETPTPQDIADGIDDESFSKPSAHYPMRGKLTKYIDPCEPVFQADDWEAMR